MHAGIDRVLKTWATLILGFLICTPAFSETAPWQQGTVVNVNRVSSLWEVTVNLGKQVLVIRPYALPIILFKTYVQPQGVSAGMTVKVAVFANGTVTLQNGSGRNYGGDILS